MNTVHSAGADIRKAIAEFRAAGWTVRQIAADIGMHVSTVYRWAAGIRRPNPANHAALAQLVDTCYSTQVHRRRLTVASVHLRNAADALVTDQQRAAEDRLAAEVRARMEAGQRRRDTEVAERRARFEQRRDSRRAAREHRPHVSVTATVDPFALVGEPEPALPFLGGTP